MNLYEYLLSTFGTDEPFYTTEINYGEYSKPWLYKELNKLCEEEKIIRYERGLYYIPTQTIFGPSILDPNKVITKKYINDGKDTVGFYSGVTFLNQLHLTTQCPNVIEIYTNNEPSNVRDAVVGKQRVILRRARTTVNGDNAAVLSFLEMMNTISSKFVDEDKKPLIEKYISDNRITRKDILQYAPLFPDKAIRTLVESELIYSVAQ
ncbi:MAG: hypothetical protein UHO61_04630 [Acutalibacteraceae bacterium]|nr:hypothetical protein [Acutalibacteraceae bacterium]